MSKSFYKMLLSIIVVVLNSAVFSADPIRNGSTLKHLLAKRLLKNNVKMNAACDFVVENWTLLPATPTTAFNEDPLKFMALINQLYQPKIIKDLSKAKNITSTLKKTMSEYLSYVVLQELKQVKNLSFSIANYRSHQLDLDDKKFDCNVTDKAADYNDLKDHIDEECGSDELSVDSNKICAVLDKLDKVIQSFESCNKNKKAKFKCYSNNKDESIMNVSNSLQELNVYHKEVLTDVKREFKKYKECMRLAIREKSSNGVNQLAQCLTEKQYLS